MARNTARHLNSVSAKLMCASIICVYFWKFHKNSRTQTWPQNKFPRQDHFRYSKHFSGNRQVSIRNQIWKHRLANKYFVRKTIMLFTFKFMSPALGIIKNLVNKKIIFALSIFYTSALQALATPIWKVLTTGLNIFTDFFLQLYILQERNPRKI